MRMNAHRFWLVSVLCCVGLVLSLAFGGFLWSAEGEGAGQSPQAPAAKPAPEAGSEDLFNVPNGTPDELLKYIEKLKAARPDVSDYAGFVKFRDKLAQAILEASEKILAAKPTDQQRVEAIHAKLIALAVLAQTGDAPAAAKLAKLPGELEKAGLADLARDAKAIVFQTRIQSAQQSGPEAYRKLVDELKKFLAAGPIGRREAALAMMAARGAEMTGDNELAVEVYHDMGKMLASSDDAAIASAGSQLEGSARRMGLVGKKMVVKGTTLGGKPFDWSKYAGKVVLVDFWATWCPACVAEIPNILENYSLYHDRGFDVVGIDLDEDRAQVAAFVEEKQLPWTVLFDGDLGDQSMADYYGVTAIPTTVLVGADGKVVALDARGPALGEYLKKLLGPAEPVKNEPPKG